MLHENCESIDQKRPAQPIDNAIEHVFQIDSRSQGSAEIKQGLPDVITVAIETFIEPDLKLTLIGVNNNAATIVATRRVTKLNGSKFAPSSPTKTTTV